MADTWGLVGDAAADLVGAMLLAVGAAWTLLRGSAAATGWIRRAGVHPIRLRSVLALAFALPGDPVPPASERLQAPPRRGASASRPPWSGLDELPPRRPARAGDISPLPAPAAPLPAPAAPLPAPADGVGSSGESGPSGHPAVHGRSASTVVPLFPRAGRKPDPEVQKAREEAMRRHPSRSGEAGGTRVHVVRHGDSLWTIAEDHLRTKDVRRVARYWPRIHRANRTVIGPNPNVIQPGWKLTLPPEEA